MAAKRFRGDHEPILDAALFADVQAKLSSQAAERRCRIRGSPALLTRRLFDVQGHRMTPTHTNKNGVRYLYYVSQAALRKESPPGSIARVPGPELEALVIDVLHRHLQANGSDPKPIPETDRELIEAHLLRVTLNANEVKVHLRAAVAGSDPAIGNDDPIVAGNAEATIAIPWTVSTATLVKGLAYVPAHNTPMKPGSRQLLLIAIAKARKWMKEVERGHSFADIARREGKAEQHIRNLAPLAFVSPRIITAIMAGTAPAGLTVTALAAGLPYSWADQEQRISVWP